MKGLGFEKQLSTLHCTGFSWDAVLADSKPDPAENLMAEEVPEESQPHDVGDGEQIKIKQYIPSNLDMDNNDE